MGASACKGRGSSCGSSLSTCVASRFDGDLDPAADGLLAGGAFSAPPDAAEHAEIARLIEAITRPPPEVLDPSGCAAQSDELGEKAGKPQPPGNAGDFALPSAGVQRPRRGQGTGGLSVQELSAVAGKARAWPVACSADSILDMVELEDDTNLQTEQGCLGGDASNLPLTASSHFNAAPTARSRENGRQGSGEAAAGDSTEDDPWGLGIPGLNVRPLEGAIQAMAARLAQGGNKMQAACSQPGEDAGREAAAPKPASPTKATWDEGSTGPVSISNLEGAVKPPDVSSLSNSLSTANMEKAVLGLDGAPRKCQNGSICIGQWSEGYLDGYGIERWRDGSVYIGDFRVGLKHGYGRMTWANGCTYEGEFARDSLNGEGLHVWNDGRGYSGQWINNSAGPRGTVRWSDGRLYRGEFYQGHMHGRGTFYWPDGRSYCGQWRQGRQHGSGVATGQRAAGPAETAAASHQDVSPTDHESLWRGIWHEGELIEWLGRGRDAPKVPEVLGPASSGRPPFPCKSEKHECDRGTPELYTPRAVALANDSSTPPPLSGSFVQWPSAGWSPDRASPLPTPRSPAKAEASPPKSCADVLRVASCSVGVCRAAENFQL